MPSPEPAVITPNKPVLPPIPHYTRNYSPRDRISHDEIDTRFFLHRPPSSPRLQKIIGKKGADTVRPEPVHLPCMSSDSILRITQLEQNLSFLQEQHQSMLTSLHQEIEALRLRNRDLQFQLIFGSSGVKVVQSSSDSSPDDAKPKIILSPKEVNNRSLQVEMLEKEVSELKASLAEANNKNSRLLQTVEHQKKQIDAKKETSETDSVGRLEDAENLIKKLVKENEEQRKEINSIRSQLNKGGGNGRYNSGRRGGGGGGGGGDHQRFPPLQTQNFWGNTSQKHKTSPEYHGGRGLEHEVVGQPAPTLPHLNRSYSQSSSNQRHRYYNNGNHFYRGNSSEEEGRRRYRGRGGGGGHYKDEN